MPPRVGVMGAGAIGSFVGGRLAARGVDVVFVGRARPAPSSGLVLSDLDGTRIEVAEEKVRFSTEPGALADRDVVLCCVKSAQTAEVAKALGATLPRGAVVVSMQNGVRNAEVLREHASETRVLGGVVGFNVVAGGDGAFRRTTSGPLAIERSDDARVLALAGELRAAGFDVDLAFDIRALQWAKLVMNVNNAVGALTDVPTRDLLFVAGYRRILAAIIAESLAVMRKAGIRPARLGAIPVGLFPYMLRLPSPVLRVVARAQLKVDPEARSSMWDDVTRGRATEVDYLNGEIVRTAEACGAAAPLNRRVVELVHEVERRGAGSPKMSADALWAALHR
jgi:2-dehydropantoate 2-reductase